MNPFDPAVTIADLGRRARIAAKASSELEATRTACPSSSRSPETSSRMSASSSTTRMSEPVDRIRSRSYSAATRARAGAGSPATPVGCRGKIRHTRAPPKVSASASFSSPPWSSQMRFTMARPSPVPFSRVVT